MMSDICIPGIEVLYFDEAVIVLHKPTAMLSVPGRGPEKQDSLAFRVQQVLPEAKVVHRLDCHTSGVMLMAIGIESQRELSRQFHDRIPEKEYIAIVRGQVAGESGKIELAMRGDPDNRPYQLLDEIHGKPARTQWNVLARSDATTRLQLLPDTGRTHQLRVHCHAIGHVVVGDGLYGGEVESREPRMLLHAQMLAFNHPQTQARMVMMADCEF